MKGVFYFEKIGGTYILKPLSTYLALILIVFLAAACTDNSPRSTVSQIKTNEIIKQKQDELGMKYNAMMNWEENFQDQLTVKIQSAMKNKTVLFKNSYLVDVYQQGGILISKLESSEGFQLILKTTPNSELSNRLLTGDLRIHSLSVIADVQELIVPQIALNSHNVDGKYAEIRVNTDTIRVVNGSLVDFIVEE